MIPPRLPKDPRMDAESRRSLVILGGIGVLVGAAVLGFFSSLEGWIPCDTSCHANWNGFAWSIVGGLLAIAAITAGTLNRLRLGGAALLVGAVAVIAAAISF